MKAVLLLTLSFLFASLTNLPLAFSKDDREPVRDTDGNPLYSGHPYRIRGKDSGGVILGKTGNSNCPATVLQDYFNGSSGLPVKINGPDPDIIYTDTSLLDINFTWNPNCANSLWSVFKDGEIEKLYVGIGDSSNHGNEQKISGKFLIQKYGSQPSNSYKLLFDPEYESHVRSVLIDVGTFDSKGGRLLALDMDKPFQVDFEYAVLLLTLSFLFASLTNLPLAFSKDDREPVRDTDGNPLSSGQVYRIRGEDSGGVILGKTGNSNCPATVLQDYFNGSSGLPVKFKGPDPDIIYTGTPLDINFTWNPNCVNSRWSLFVDPTINEAYVGIGDLQNHKEDQLYSGKFFIQKYTSQPSNSYKFVFCPYYPSKSTKSVPCFDIGTYDNGQEDGKRLVGTNDSPLIVVFEKAYKSDATIKSV
ncbi:Kunitz-type trypsin inhibitor-like 1 protein, partial [Mucuna pruriens]